MNSSPPICLDTRPSTARCDFARVGKKRNLMMISSGCWQRATNDGIVAASLWNPSGGQERKIYFFFSFRSTIEEGEGGREIKRRSTRRKRFFGSSSSSRTAIGFPSRLQPTGSPSTTGWLIRSKLVMTKPHGTPMWSRDPLPCHSRPQRKEREKKKPKKNIRLFHIRQTRSLYYLHVQ